MIHNIEGPIQVKEARVFRNLEKEFVITEKKEKTAALALHLCLISVFFSYEILYPGDVLETTCFYDTRGRFTPTSYGYDNLKDEMCNARKLMRKNNQIIIFVPLFLRSELLYVGKVIDQAISWGSNPWEQMSCPPEEKSENRTPLF